MITLTIDTDKVVLSSETLVYKTERFMRETNRFKDINLVLTKISESMILNQCKGNYAVHIHNDTFFVKAEKDIVFYKYSGADAFIRKGDGRFSDYLQLPRQPAAATPVPSEAFLTQSKGEYLTKSLARKSLKC